MGFVLLAAVGLIAFGTLYPFTFQCGGTIGSALSAFKPLVRQVTRGDLAGNLVLFLPFGLAFMAWARRLPMASRFMLAVAAGAILSFAIELTQSCIPGRTSSWSDVALNTISTAIGALALPLFRRLSGSGRSGLDRADVAAALLLGCFLVWQLAPFVPTIDWQKWKTALKPLLLTPQIGPAMVLSYIVVWMMVARLSLAVFRPARPLLLWGVLLAAQQAAELVVIGKTLRAGELLGAILGILLARVLFAGGATAVRDRLLLPLFAAYVVHVGLEPYAFASVAKPFGWLPFEGFVRGSMFAAVQAAGQKLFCYGGLIWLLHRAGLGIGIAGLLTALAVLGMEIGQMYLPGRVAESTDPVLALMAAAVLWLGDRRGGRVAPSARYGTIPPNDRTRGAKR